MSKQSFLYGTIILIIAGLFTRFLGFVNRIVVARLIGEEGVGIYMMTIPTLMLLITLTQIGLPVAIAKFVAEAEANNDSLKIRNILTISLFLTGILSIIFSIGLFFISPWLANLLNEERTMLTLMFISPIIPIIAVSSILKGYFQGKQNMKPQSISVVVEQIIRISCVALFIKLLLPYGIEYAAAGAMVSVLLGELGSLFYLVYCYKKEKFPLFTASHRQEKNSKRAVMNELFSIAIPTTGSRLIGSFSAFLEPILIAQCMAIAGYSAMVTTKLYGELTGFVMPLLLLPTFITFSLSIALVPSIAEAEAKQNHSLIHYRIHQSIRISFASGALATIVFTLFPANLLHFMYGKTEASYLLLFLSPFFLFLYIQAPLQAALQALNIAKQAMWNSIIGVIIKLALLILLTSQERFGMMGVAISIATSVILVTLLHLFTLYKEINFKIAKVDIVKMLTLLIITYYVGVFLKSLYSMDQLPLIAFIILLSILSLLYFLLLFLLRFITMEELRQIPWINKWLPY